MKKCNGHFHARRIMSRIDTLEVLMLPAWCAARRAERLCNGAHHHGASIAGRRSAARRSPGEHSAADALPSTRSGTRVCPALSECRKREGIPTGKPLEKQPRDAPAKVVSARPAALRHGVDLPDRRFSSQPKPSWCSVSPCKNLAPSAPLPPPAPCATGQLRQQTARW